MLWAKQLPSNRPKKRQGSRAMFETRLPAEIGLTFALRARDVSSTNRQVFSEVNLVLEPCLNPAV